ncbi:MAG: C45 family autoproteolytic acyltransferase/hydrolase, partial [Myxococcota bacterium]
MGDGIDSGTQAALPVVESLTLRATDPRGRGREHGEHWRAAVHALAERRHAHLAAHRSRAEIETWANSVLGLMAQVVPALHAELCGIAEGADLAPERVITINAADDFPARADVGGDTSIYFNGLEGPCMGHTWILRRDLASSIRVVRHAELGAVVTVPGSLGIAGLTADGLAVVGASLSQNERGPGLPWPALMRSALAGGSASAALAVFKSLPRASGRYAVLADRGEFFGVESSASRAVLTQVGARAAHL